MPVIEYAIVHAVCDKCGLAKLYSGATIDEADAKTRDDGWSLDCPDGCKEKCALSCKHVVAKCRKCKKE